MSAGLIDIRTGAHAAILAALFAFVLPLAGCQTIAEREAELDRIDDQRCQQYGARPGTEGYVRCRTDLDRNRAIAAANRQPVIVQRQVVEVDRVYVREPRPVFFPSPRPQPYPPSRPPGTLQPGPWQPPPPVRPTPLPQPPVVGPRPLPPIAGPGQPGPGGGVVIGGPSVGGPGIARPPGGGVLPLCATVPPGAPCRPN